MKKSIMNIGIGAVCLMMTIPVLAKSYTTVDVRIPVTTSHVERVVVYEAQPNTTHQQHIQVGAKISHKMGLSEHPYVINQGGLTKISFKDYRNAERFVNFISYQPYNIRSNTYRGERKSIQQEGGYYRVYLTNGQYHHMRNVLGHGFYQKPPAHVIYHQADQRPRESLTIGMSF
jgi:hypothetical protein